MRLLKLPAASAWAFLASFAAAVQTVVEGDFSSFALDPQSTSGGSTFLTRVVNGKAQLILQPQHLGSLYGSIFVPFPADATVGSAIKITTRFKVTNPGESFADNTNTAPMPADPSNLCTMYILNIYRPVGSNSMSYAYFAAGQHQPTDGVTYTETLPNRVVPDDPANSPMRFYWYASCSTSTMEYQFEYLKVEFDVTPPVTTTTTTTATEVTTATETTATATEETTVTTETSTQAGDTTPTTAEETNVDETTTADENTTTIEEVTTSERITTATEETSITQGITTTMTSSTDETAFETMTTTTARISSSFSSSAPPDEPSSTSKTTITQPSFGTTTETEITPSPTSTTPSSAPSSTSVPADPPTSDAFVPLGCYTAVGDFQSFRLKLFSDVMTVDLCVEACQGQQFAGTYDQ